MLRTAIVVLLMATPALAAPSWMVGTWFGTGQPHDRSSMYIDRMRPDGSWRGEYRTCNKGKSEDLVQEGSWSLQGDVLLLKVQTVEGMPMPRLDRYRMVEHTATMQKYVELPMNFSYTPSRVPDGYKMPSCQLVS